jgi:AcrR family transcriptional regulator
MRSLAIRSKALEPDVNVGDFRVRVAGEKRARMRERLIAATMDAYLTTDPGRHPVIDDVIGIAGVSRGTFYKYFDSLDEVLPEIGRRMANEMLDSFELLFGPIDDAAVRIAAGPLMGLARSAMEPRHAAFISRVDFTEYLGGKDRPSQVVARSFLDGRERGVLKFESIDAAIDVVIGTTVEGARRILRTRKLDGGYIREVATMVMLALGVPRKTAERAVGQAWQRLQQSSDSLPWWKPVRSA